ncbi:MAG: hypothetical protein IJ644_09380 [Oscillospiraceae bacterium]|nr:hypothetical protein [Oscillospiraceae bacterium]
MKEELLAYALLSDSGFDTRQIFEERLHQLFLEHPEIDKDLLEMECLSIPKAMTYLRQHFDYENFSQDALQKYLILTLKAFYLKLPFMEFAQKIAGLWDVLPFHTNREDSPFYMAYDFWTLFISKDFELLKQNIEDLVFYYDKSQIP